MTLFHTVHPPVAHEVRPARKIALPAWTGRIAWERIAAIGLNVALWGVIILGARALLRSLG